MASENQIYDEREGNKKENRVVLESGPETKAHH
jgi:hypothetical protein